MLNYSQPNYIRPHVCGAFLKRLCIIIYFRHSGFSFDMPEKDTEKDTEEVTEKGTEKSTAEKSSQKYIDNECSKFDRWGLGRGVDITKQTPWLEKTSFQVRAVSPKVILETDDGGLLKAFSEEVRSKTTVNSEVQAGIVRPTYHYPFEWMSSTRALGQVRRRDEDKEANCLFSHRFYRRPKVAGEKRRGSTA